MNPDKETIKPKNKNRPTCRQDTYVTVISKIRSKRFFILHHSSGTHNGKPNYYISTTGERFPAGKFELIKRNTGIVFL